jgi:hypothetical protein
MTDCFAEGWGFESDSHHCSKVLCLNSDDAHQPVFIASTATNKIPCHKSAT